MLVFLSCLLVVVVELETQERMEGRQEDGEDTTSRTHQSPHRAVPRPGRLSEALGERVAGDLQLGDLDESLVSEEAEHAREDTDLLVLVGGHRGEDRLREGEAGGEPLVLSGGDLNHRLVLVHGVKTDLSGEFVLYCTMYCTLYCTVPGACRPESCC